MHEGALREAIHHLKFNGRDALGRILGHHLGQVIPAGFDSLVPVPLHRSRLRERGYNQALLVAKGIAGVLKLTVTERGLQRLRSTGHQAKLSRQDRLQNLAGAFTVSNPGVPPWRGQRILLVDDVLTTGATAAAAARLLLETGAREVNLAVLAVSATPIETGWNHHALPKNTH